jgi:hypothetical protein
MIDKKTGNIIFGKDILINLNLDFDSVSKMGLGESQEVDDKGNGWIWLRIKNISNSGYFFNISFAFKNQILKELSFIVSDKRFDSNSNWSDWTEQKELDDLEFYNDWLNKKIGKQREFDWGNIWATYDRKGGSSSIGLRYNE